MQQYITAAATRQQAPTANISRQTTIAAPEETPASASAETAITGNLLLFILCGCVSTSLPSITTTTY